MSFKTMTSKQGTYTDNTKKLVMYFFDYIIWYSDSIVCFYILKMIIQFHSDALQLTAPKVRSQAGCHFPQDLLPINNQPIHLNGPIHSPCIIIKNCKTSSCSQTWSTLLKFKKVHILQLILYELEHTQRPSQIYIDNTIVVSIINDTIYIYIYIYIYIIFLCHRNAILLVIGSRNTKVYFQSLSPWKRKPQRFIQQGVHRKKDTERATSFYTHNKFSHRTLVQAIKNYLTRVHRKYSRCIRR